MFVLTFCIDYPICISRCKALLCQTKYLLGLLGTMSKLQNESMTVIFQTVKCVAALNVG